MASRWRRWDAHFATDVLENKFQFTDSLDSLPVGTRGKFRFNIPPNLLVIPTILDKSDSKVGGRGRRLRDQTELKEATKMSEKQKKEKVKHRQEFLKNVRQEKLEMEWPSLVNGKVSDTQQEKSKSITLKCKPSKQSTSKNKTPSSTFQFEDAELELDVDVQSNNDIQTHSDKAQTMTNDIESDFNSHLDNSPNKESDDTVLISNTSKSDCSLSLSPFEENIDKAHLSYETNQFEINQDIIISNNTSEASETINLEHSETNNLELNETLSNINNTVKKEQLSNLCLEQSFTTDEFLKTLENPEYYILVENLSINADEEDFKELVTSFGEIASIYTQPCSDGIHKNVLVKMVDSDHCVWVISCLDGDIYEEGGERLSAKAVDDLILAMH